MQFIKIYGERNTGTNIIRDAIAEHYHCEFLSDGGGKRLKPDYLMNAQKLSGIDRVLYEEALFDDTIEQNLTQSLGWKHACPPVNVIVRHPRSRQTLFVIITKSPYAWLLSLYKRPYHQLYSQEQSFSEFLRTYWITARREGLKALLENPIALYNAKLKSYQNFQAIGKKTGLHILHIRYEDFLFSFEETMGRFGVFLEPRTQNAAWNYPGASNKGDVLDFKGYQEKYKPENRLNQISNADLSFINMRLQPSLLKAFGYKIENRK